MWIGLIWLKTGTGEYGKEPSGSIEGGKFLDELSVLLASEEGISSLELVSK
jgi:hypothetical protein